MSVTPGHRVTLVAADGTRVAFDAAPQQSLVRAAARAGILITSGCLQGRCAICRGKLISGAVAPLRRPSPHAVATDGEGVVRLCSVSARSDLEIAPLSRWRRVQKT